MKTFQISIKGEKWKYVILSDKSFMKRFVSESDSDHDAHAIVPNEEKRQVYFRASKLTFGTCVHELLHMYMNETHTHRSGISNHDLEEIVADVLDQYILKIVGQAATMYCKMLKVIDKTPDKKTEALTKWRKS